jgi:hypothetical protein
MEYYALVLNRTYLVRVGDREITGSVCRGLTAAAGGADRLTHGITRWLSVPGNLADPASHVDHANLAETHRANFAIALSTVQSVAYDPRRKWGMGYYPHDGRVTIVTARKKRELIILGAQDGHEIGVRLKAAVQAAQRLIQIDASGAA